MSISIRPLQASDADLIPTLIDYPDILNNLRDGIPSPYKKEDAVSFINASKTEGKNLSFAIVYNHEFAGVISLMPQSNIHRKNMEIGYWVAKSFWGKGVVSKAIGLICNYGFKTFDIERIFAGVFDYNSASMKALKKNGFELEGVAKNAVVKNNVLYDEHRYALLKP